MGVLDEAIRQHLELKRRRGADAGEIEREQDEALGDAVAQPRAAVAEEDPGETPEAQVADESHSSAHQPTEAFDASEVAEALGHAPEMPAEPDEAVADAETETQHEADTEPEPDPPEPVEEPSAPAEEPVSEEAEASEPDELEQADPDELEETPEFLEDAPEHDKLWFEQKPPKDFDF
jgi:hypothetical protein